MDFHQKRKTVPKNRFPIEAKPKSEVNWSKLESGVALAENMPTICPPNQNTQHEISRCFPGKKSSVIVTVNVGVYLFSSLNIKFIQICFVEDPKFIIPNLSVLFTTQLLSDKFNL